MNGNGTIFYQGQVDICRKHLNPEQFGRLMCALFDLAGGGDPDVGEDIALAFDFMALQQGIDRDKYRRKCERNRENGKKGGRPRKEKSEEKNPEKANGFFENPNNNNHNNNNNNNHNILSGKPDQISFLINYLNKSTNRHYSTGGRNADMVGALLETYTTDDIRGVIDRMVGRWRDDDKMSMYLRPRTLFDPERFEEYFNAEDVSARKDEQKAAAVAERVAALSGELEAVKDRIVVADDRTVRSDLELRRAWLEDEIKRLKGA